MRKMAILSVITASLISSLYAVEQKVDSIGENKTIKEIITTAISSNGDKQQQEKKVFDYS